MMMIVMMMMMMMNVVMAMRMIDVNVLMTLLTDTEMRSE
jgi:hypothetical protein